MIKRVVIVSVTIDNIQHRGICSK